MSSPAAIYRTQPLGTVQSGRAPTVRGTIVHLGAGDGRDLPEYPGAKRVILVEADPEQARELRRLARGDGRLLVVAAAVSTVAGTNRLKRFRLRAFSSLRTPTGLRELYPGLRLHDEIEVETITPRDLISSHRLRPQQDNWLIIDTPGEEAAIVQALRESGDLAVFDRIDLCCGVSDHYQGAANAAAVLRALDEAGYDVESFDDSTDPERPRWSLYRNPLRLQNRELREQLAEAIEARDRLSQQLAQALAELKQVRSAAESSQAQMAEARKLAEAHRVEIERLQRERDEWREFVAQRDQTVLELGRARDEMAQRLAQHESRIGDLIRERDAALAAQEEIARELGELQTEIERTRSREAELRGQLATREAGIGRLTEERDAALTQAGSLGRQIEAMKAQANRDAEALRGRLNEATSNVERLGQLLADRESSVETLDAEVRALRAELEKRDARIAELGQKLEEQVKSVAARDGEVQNLRADLSVAIRLQSMREADLRDLQASYAELLRDKKERDELLAELASRLDVVARYLTRGQ